MAQSDSVHIHRHRHPTYPVRKGQRIYAIIAAPLVIVVLAALIVLYSPTNGAGQVSISELIRALGASMLRLIVAYILALALSLPLALLINRSVVTERILMPAFDILQSVPVLAFFPVVIIFFIHHHLLEGAAVFIIFINMLWNIVFSLVGGLRLVPGDVKDAAKLFGVRGTDYVRQFLIPSVFPYLVTGSLLSWAEGWNMLIVAEVLHTYIPQADTRSDLFGIGSVMVHASAAGHGNVFVGAIVTMVVAIAVMNFFVWQRLLGFSERFRFE